MIEQGSVKVDLMKMPVIARGASTAFEEAHQVKGLGFKVKRPTRFRLSV